MTSETDLSTADLAQPGGARPQDRADEEPSRAGRTYETEGNRVAGEPAGLEAAAGSAGSTRDDAIRADAPYPGRAGGPDADPDAEDRGMADRDVTDRSMGERDRGRADMAGEGMTERDMGDRGMGDRDMADRDMAERGTPGQGTPGQGMTGQEATGDVALLDPTDAEGFRQRWSDTQARFVDDPREAVQTADGLVAELMQTLASSFSQHKGELESHWRSGGNPDTEDLRQALQRYRSFFDRLLSA